ncbi:MAG: HK97 family phage prohead protease [Bacteroidetes bacterium]|nr:HK97 family phage prohead protease [Bacteroidota bacterium]
MDKQNLERRNVDIKNVEIRKTEDGVSVMVGVAAPFNKWSLPLGGFREQIAPGTFADSLRDDTVLAYWNHNSDLLLGNTESKTLTLSEDVEGLRFELELPDTQAGRDATVLVNRKDVRGMSIGFITRKQEWDETDEDDIKRTLLAVELKEISLTPRPAYPDTLVQARSIADEYKTYKEMRAAEDVNDGSVDLLKKITEMKSKEI